MVLTIMMLTVMMMIMMIMLMMIILVMMMMMMMMMRRRRRRGEGKESNYQERTYICSMIEVTIFIFELVIMPSMSSVV